MGFVRNALFILLIVNFKGRFWQLFTKVLGFVFIYACTKVTREVENSNPFHDFIITMYFKLQNNRFQVLLMQPTLLIYYYKTIIYNINCPKALFHFNNKNPLRWINIWVKRFVIHFKVMRCQKGEYLSDKSAELYGLAFTIFLWAAIICTPYFRLYLSVAGCNIT